MDRTKPVVQIFAGPNGSGKTVIARIFPAVGTYVNANDLKMEYGLTDLEAAQKAEELRGHLLARGADFSFETVLSTERNLLLLQKAKGYGYEVRSIYVLTCDENINIARIKARSASGGHDVPEDQIRARYHRALSLLPHLIGICDKIAVYDNSTDIPVLIFDKLGNYSEAFRNNIWSMPALQKLLGLLKKQITAPIS